MNADIMHKMLSIYNALSHVSDPTESVSGTDPLLTPFENGKTVMVLKFDCRAMYVNDLDHFTNI